MIVDKGYVKFIDKLIEILIKLRIKNLLSPLIDMIYLFYERYLLKQIANKNMPMHIAIIPNGNRRWAQTHGLDPIEGHRYGYEKMRDVLQWIYDLGIKVVTIYAMSYENCLYRSENEKENLFNIIKNGFEELINSDIIHKYRVRIKVFGKIELVRDDVIKYAKLLEKETKEYSDRYLNIALCYGGRQEIVNAIKNIALDILNGKIKLEDISEDYVRKYLDTSHLKSFSEPDLVIRTSGEMRISNFLLWQIAYSELYFCDVFWPDFRKIDLYRAIRSYQRRERRFGR
uniref:Tritrans,polycis-undecaprenyl-diphosphate synthase (geranylgeranyl-diphosphate specific) n=1 Tax=Ignisphaera aggregans TaxID=334771 RepID=A0A7C5UU38_9CREN